MDSTGKALFVLSIVTAVLAILAGILRFVASRHTGRKQGCEDLLAYAAISIHLIFISTNLDGIPFSLPF
jgi:hypothetical protein